MEGEGAGMKDIFADYQLDRQLDRATSNINRLRETFGLPSDSERLGKFKCAYSGQAPAPPPAETAAPSAETAAPSSRRAISLTPAPTRCAQAGILHVTTYHLCFLGAKARKMTIPYGDITTVGMQVVAAPPRAHPALPPPRGTPRTHRPSPVPLRPGEEGRAEGSLALRGPSHLAQRRTEKQRERHLHGHRGEGRLLENDRRCGQGAGRDARLTPLRLDNYWRAQRSARADMRGERGSTSMDIVGSPAHGAVRARLGRRCGLSKDMSSRGRAAHVVKREKKTRFARGPPGSGGTPPRGTSPSRVGLKFTAFYVRRHMASPSGLLAIDESRGGSGAMVLTISSPRRRQRDSGASASANSCFSFADGDAASPSRGPELVLQEKGFWRQCKLFLLLLFFLAMVLTPLSGPLGWPNSNAAAQEPLTSGGPGTTNGGRGGGGGTLDPVHDEQQAKRGRTGVRAVTPSTPRTSGAELEAAEGEFGGANLDPEVAREDTDPTVQTETAVAQAGGRSHLSRTSGSGGSQSHPSRFTHANTGHSRGPERRAMPRANGEAVPLPTAEGKVDSSSLH